MPKCLNHAPFHTRQIAIALLQGLSLTGNLLWRSHKGGRGLDLIASTLGALAKWGLRCHRTPGMITATLNLQKKKMPCAKQAALIFGAANTHGRICRRMESFGRLQYHMVFWFFWGMDQFEEKAVKYENCTRTLLDFKVGYDKSRVKPCGWTFLLSRPLPEASLSNLEPDESLQCSFRIR